MLLHFYSNMLCAMNMLIFLGDRKSVCLKLRMSISFNSSRNNNNSKNIKEPQQLPRDSQSKGSISQTTYSNQRPQQPQQTDQRTVLAQGLNTAATHNGSQPVHGTMTDEVNSCIQPEGSRHMVKQGTVMSTPRLGSLEAPSEQLSQPMPPSLERYLRENPSEDASIYGRLQAQQQPQSQSDPGEDWSLYDACPRHVSLRIRVLTQKEKTKFYGTSSGNSVYARGIMYFDRCHRRCYR